MDPKLSADITISRVARPIESSRGFIGANVALLDVRSHFPKSR
jgi:hypothetical protein